MQGRRTTRREEMAEGRRADSFQVGSTSVLPCCLFSLKMRARVVFRNVRSSSQTSCWCEWGQDFACMPSSGGHGPWNTGAQRDPVFPWPHHGIFLSPTKQGPNLNDVSKNLMSFWVWEWFPLFLWWGFPVVPTGYSSMTSQCGEGREWIGTVVELQDGGTAHTFSEQPH